MKKQSFVWGAMILMIANAVSKILGATFKIPLTYILQEEGMAIYNSAFQIYALFLSFVISGIPFAVAKLTSEYSAKSDKEKIVSVKNCGMVMLFLLGVAGTALLYAGAEFFAIAMKEERAVFAIRMLSPSVLFVALSCVYKNYFQGRGNMIPTAVSQVIEALVRLVAGYALAVAFAGFGKVAASGGASLGVSIGEVISFLIMLVFFRLSSKDLPKSRCHKEIAKEIVTIAFPLLIASVLSALFSVVDTSMLRKRLIEFGNTIEEARFLYGAYTGYALTVFHLPVGILATFGVSILPVMAGALASGNTKKAQSTAALAVKINVILSIPCAVGIYYLSDLLLDTLFHNTASADMLSMLAPCVIFLCVAQICSSMLNSAGKIMLSFSLGAISMLIKIAVSYFMVGEMNIYGAIVAADIAYFIDMVISLIAVKKVIGPKLDIKGHLLKPIASGVIMMIVILFIKEPVCGYLQSSFLQLGVIGAVAVVCYLLSLLLFG